jgi:hypothetical protein
MPRIPYADLSAITDPEILGYLEDARIHGAPRPESQAIRAHVPAVIRAFSQAWQTTFRTGVLDHGLKELCLAVHRVRILRGAAVGPVWIGEHS